MWTPNILTTPQDWSIRLNTVSCTGDHSQYCTAIANSSKSSGLSKIISYTTDNGGVTWTQHLVNESNDASLSIEAAAVTCYGELGQSCLIVGNAIDRISNTQTPVSFTSDDGGNTWVMNSNFQGIKSGMRIYGISNNSGDI